MSPFWFSGGGGLHDSESDLERTATPVGLKGGLVGADEKVSKYNHNYE